MRRIIIGLLLITSYSLQAMDNKENMKAHSNHVISIPHVGTLFSASDPADSTLNIAQTLYNKKKFQQAAQLAREITKQKRNEDARINAAFLLGGIHYTNGNYSKARKQLKHVMQCDKTEFQEARAYAQNLWHKMNIYQGNYQDSLPYFKKMTKQGVDSEKQAEAFLLLGTVYCDQKNPTKASNYFHEALYKTQKEHIKKAALSGITEAQNQMKNKVISLIYTTQKTQSPEASSSLLKKRKQNNVKRQLRSQKRRK